MKKIGKITMLIYVLVAFSCSKDDSSVPIEEPAKSSAKRITSFVFKAESNEVLETDIPGVIDEAAKTITSTVPFGTDVSALTPEISYSDKATISPNGNRDFRSNVSYNVKAEDGSQVTYNASVKILPNDEALILSFQFLASENPNLEEDVMANIDHEMGSISFDVPDGANITALLPRIEVSSAAAINSEGPKNFKKTVIYTVTAENGVQKTYTVHPRYSQRGVLIEFYRANPESSIQWDLENENIASWEGISVNGEGGISSINLQKKNIRILPPEIGQLTDLKFLTLTENIIFEIPDEIGQLDKLSHLSIPVNKIKTIPVAIGKLVSLENLNLRSNLITSIPKEIGKLENLTTLFLYVNRISEIPPEIAQLGKLTKFNLGENEISSIPLELIEHLDQLQELHLYENEIGEIPVEMGQLISLTSLRLEGNDLTSLPEEIGNLINLTKLDLRRNENLTSIPIKVCELTELYGTQLLVDNGVTCQ